MGSNNEQNQTRQISSAQAELYAGYEQGTADKLVEIATKFIHSKPVRILDIGGASGYFANLLADTLDGECQIIVVDNMEYDNWKNAKKGVRFVKASIFDVISTFEDNSFDIVFANLVFHHLINETYSSTLAGYASLLEQIKRIIKPDGVLSVYECYYGGFICRNHFAPVVYKLTTSSFPPFTKLAKCFGSKSAGVGVCFLPPPKWEKMYNRIGFRIADKTIVSDRMLKHKLINERFFRYELRKGE
ncbi:MAG: class I SAM-dependent methyltransferase [Clostridiales bacterium]|nr:class I SAM-dependent methyltransferase [Clostridiales bacterium]